MSSLKLSAAGLVLASLLWGGNNTAQGAEARSDAYQRLLKEASLALLKDGNNRFVEGRLEYPNQDAARRLNTATEGQEPFATVLACSDSRQAVELVFDRGVGDLFVVRVAGNVAGESEMATVEYGVGHLGTPLLVVMGHSGCGAVSAVAKGAELHGHLPHLARHIQPAVLSVRAQGVNTNEFIPRSIEANVWHTISDLLRDSEIIRKAVTEQKVQVVGAVYDLSSGKVKWLGAHPEQDAFLAEPESPKVEHGEPMKPKPELEVAAKESGVRGQESSAGPLHRAAKRPPIPSAYLWPEKSAAE